MHSARQKTHPHLNYTSPLQGPHSLNVIPQLDHKLNYHTHTLNSSFLIAFQRAKAISYTCLHLSGGCDCTATKISSVLTPCDQSPQLHRHLLVQADVCYVYKRPDILIQASVCPTLSSFRGYLKNNISLANMTLQVHINISMIALKSYVL